MNNYLLQLLKEVKTIIIPGLGAITLTNEHTGEMMFMSYLKFDDGNLAKHIAEKEGIDSNDAKNLIAKFVREVTAQLDKGESYDMYQFGTFRKVDGEITFDQWTGNNTPASDMVATEINPTQEPEKDPGAEITPEVESHEENSIREELPSTESEAMGAAIAAAVVGQETPEDQPEIMETLPEPEREEAMTAIVPDEPESVQTTDEKPVVELTGHGFETESIPAAVIRQPEPIQPPQVPVSEAPPVTRNEPGLAPSPKEILEAKDAQKAAKQQAKKKTLDAPKSRKKTSVLSYILWGLLVLLLGGGTYVAVNYDTLKQDFPVLAELTGESEKPIAPAPSVEDTPVAEPDPAETPAEEPVAEEAPQPVEEPAPAPPVIERPIVQPAPAKPSRPRVSSGNSSITIGQPDPSKPFHVIGGSFSSPANAKRFARELIAKGQPSVIVGETGGMYRVSISSFATKDEAVAANAQLKSIAPSSWVFKWP